MTDIGMRWRRLFLVAGVFALLSLSGTAGAQTDAANKAAARSLGLEGIQLAMDGNCEAALDKLTRANQLYFAPTIAVWLGECQIKQGQLVAGTETLQRVVREPLAPDAPTAFRSSQMRAQTLLDETLPRLANLTVNVQAPAGAQYEVRFDGQVLPGAVIGVSHPVDPGKHVVEATGAGLVPVTESITLPDGGTDTLTLSLLPEQADEPPARAASVPVATDTSAAGQPTPDAGVTSGNRGMKVAGYSALAVGGLGIIAGSAFGISATRQRNDLDDVCPKKACPESARSDYDAMKSSATVSTVGFVIGGIGLAAGAGLLIVAHGGEHRTSAERHPGPRVHVAPVVGLGSAGLRGSF